MALRKIDLMHRLFGKCSGHTCKECNNLERIYANGRPLSKCKVYGITSSEASDWVQKNEACGMFNRPWDKGPIIRTVNPERKEKDPHESEPIEGQLTIDCLSCSGLTTAKR